jgi:hypothetical protein
MVGEIYNKTGLKAQALQRLKCSSYNPSDLIVITFTIPYFFLINTKLNTGRSTHTHINLWIFSGILSFA